MHQPSLSVNPAGPATHAKGSDRSRRRGSAGRVLHYCSRSGVDEQEAERA